MKNKQLFEAYTDAADLARLRLFDSVADMWESVTAEFSDATALTDGEKTVSYSELDREVGAFRALLASRGVKAGDKVGVQVHNSIDFVKAFLAINTLGAAAVLLPAHLDAITVFGCSMKFGLGALVFGAPLKDNTAILAAKNPAVALIGAEETSDTVIPAVKVDPRSLSCVLFTGGTTGKSKGARLSHRAVMYGVYNGCFGYSGVFSQRYFLVLPLTHVFGLIRNLLTSLATGSAMFICRNNKDMFRDIAVFRPTIMVIVPALAEMALGLSKQFGRNMLGPDMKTIICGAAAVAPYLVNEYAELGITLLPGYGMTETANLVSGNPRAKEKPDSVGVIYEGFEYKIVDGELWLRGDEMMDGYVGDEENELAYEDGWFKTGDLVRVDEDGYLYITGRKKEIIVLQSGENVSPAELESCFYALDAVQDCLVYEADGTLAVEILPRAAAVARLGITDIMAYMKEKSEEINAALPSFARITKIIIRDKDFVRSPAMKILRNQNAKS